MGKVGDYMSLANMKAILAEFLGTAFLVYLGLASCLNWTHNVDHDQLIRIGFTFGLALVGIIYMFGPISGGHVNPAVTIACIVAGRMNGFLGAMYILIQFLGATCGAGILYLVQDEKFEGPRGPQFGVTKVNPDLTVEQGLFIEFFATFIFVLAILLITDKSCEDFSRGSIALGIGFTLVTVELGFINATGGSLNPARSFGPALIVLHFEHLWVYMIGPIFGGVMASITYRLFTYEPQVRITLDGGAQTIGVPGDMNPSNSNAVFVSSDSINNPSYDQILIEDDVKGK